ncbi:MAG: ZIP family metal transporter [Candidatus Marinimicrobia bacterium]|nr:ZIP family metal transporter [Candidatus Neomarinimicrobiota bacterium]
MEILTGIHPVFLALLGGLFTYFMTAAGAAGVFFTGKNASYKMDGMLGFAAGVMIAASFWSLLAPALELAEGSKLPAWVPVALGFLTGGFSIWGVDKLLPHLHLGDSMDKAEGPKTSWRRSTLLILAVTLHNIPEGLAVGVAFGAIGAGLSSASLAGAVALAIGIGVQNFPEGMAISMPLRREGMSKGRSFWYGQLSGIVEPISAVIGASLVMISQSILPFALAFAAGAMIFVVVEELIPEAQREGNTDRPTVGAMIGFTLMMILDVALG